MVFGGRLDFSDGPFTWDYARGRTSMRLQAELHPRTVSYGHSSVLRDRQIIFT